MIRILGYLLVNIIILSFLSWLLPNFHIENWVAAGMFVIVLTLLNWTVIPIIKFFAVPVNFMTLGLVNAVINLIAIIATVRIMTPDIRIDGGFGTEVLVAFLISIGLGFAHTVVNQLIHTK